MPTTRFPCAIGALGLLVAGAAGVRAATVYVDDDAPQGGNGTSWSLALNNLQEALIVANPDDEIHVARGVYRPDVGAGFPPGDQDRAFLINDRNVFGGYAGIGAPDPDARDVEAYEAILSGDLNADDGPDFQNRADNAHTVVAMIGQIGATLDGFTITGAFGGDHGSTVAGSLARIRNCRFHHNVASNGGALLVSFPYGALSTVEACVFEDNRAEWDGSPRAVGGVGGAVYIDGFGAFHRCRFSRNEAVVGGAVGSFYDGNGGVFTNCIFTANQVAHATSWSAGGAVANIDEAHSFLFQHCLFYGNSAPEGTGGGILSSGGPPQLRNCILWHNADNSGETFEAQVSPFPAPIGGTYGSLTNLIQNAPAFGPDIHVAMGAEPRFIDPEGPDGTLGTGDDDFRPAFGSPAIDAASSALSGDVGVDYRGFLRPVDDPATPNALYPAIGVEATGDIGPYEYQEDCDADGVVDSVAIAAGDVDDCDANGAPDACQTFHDCNANGEPDECEIASGAAEDCNANGVPDACDIASGTSRDENYNGVPDECEPTVLYVDAAPGRGADAWADPFTDLQSALAAARARHAPTEIWVAGGTYPTAPPGGSVRRAFDLVPGVPVRGGFAGNETSPDQRVPGAHETILSGDLDANDDPNDEDTFEENALTVVRAAACDGLALENVTIAGGAGRLRPSIATFHVNSASDQGYDIQTIRQPGDSAAALDVISGHPRLERVGIARNRGRGAIVNLALGAHPSMKGCEIGDNFLLGDDSTLVGSSDVRPLASSTVIGNAELLRGAIPAYLLSAQLNPTPAPAPASLSISETQICGNHADGDLASVICTYRTDIDLDRTLIKANLNNSSIFATKNARVISAFLGDSEPSGSPLAAHVALTNSAILANAGRAMVLDERRYDFETPLLTLRNSTIADNGAGFSLSRAFASIENSILFNDADKEFVTTLYLAAASPGIVHHNTIKGFDTSKNNGTNVYDNIPDDPMFVDPIGPDGIPRTGDEDFSLISGSTSIDSGDASVLGPDVTTDLAGNPRLVDDPLTPNTGVPDPFGIPLDRGAYETQAPPNNADLNADGVVNILDFGIFAQRFGTDVAPGSPGDLNGDGRVDVADFGDFATAFTGGS